VDIKIESATVVLGNGTDTVLLHTNLPSPFPKEVSSQNLILSFSATYDTGADYCEKTFNITPKIIPRI